jgi:transcriptional regulator with XRE-family HTH domain
MIGEKFKAVRKHKGLTLQEVAGALGLKSTGHLSQIERGEKEASPSLVNNFRSTFSVSEIWWETGKGDMFRDIPPEVSRVEEPKENYGGYISAVADMMRSMDEETQKDIYLSVQKEKLLRELLSERLDKKAG